MSFLVFFNFLLFRETFYHTLASSPMIQTRLPWIAFSPGLGSLELEAFATFSLLHEEIRKKN